jgi:serine/threonine protein kinase
MNKPTLSVETILADAVEIASAVQRQAFVERACAGDAALRQRVEQLIANHFEAGSFLERPAVNLDAAGAITPTPEDARRETVVLAEGLGTVIGPYKLLEQIGEGGMGLVFVAEQQHPVKRRVALKIIKPGMDSRQVIARFEAERQALAMMDHTNIARVYDGGSTPAGRPYFVMELVKGTPITHYCDKQRLPTHRRLELFLDVCQAVQHAHQKGIIHRDLKPSNVLVSHHDVSPVIKVIDFGIAKPTSGQLTDMTVYTAFAQLVGTPLYMSPEQAGSGDLDVDTRSDVYSLGVLLYELLTGTTPFDGETLKSAGYEEMRRIIREDEPPVPSARLSTMPQAHLCTIADKRSLEPYRLSRQVRGDLDWIVMKALEKDRNRRYESASALASDVQACLNDQSVQACPPSASYRFRKFVRRNRRLIATLSIILTVLVVATAVSIRQAFRARAAEQRAASEAEIATAINNFLLQDLLRQASVQVHIEEGFAGNPNLTVKEALDRAAAKIETRFQDQPVVEAAIRLTIGRAYRTVGERELALTHLERAADLYTTHLGTDHPATLDSLFFLAMAYQDERITDAIALLEHTFERRKATLGPDHSLTLVTLNSLGEACRKAGQLEKAEQVIRRALERKKIALGLDCAITANSIHDLALVCRDSGRYSEAIALFEQATEKLAAFSGPRPCA